MSLSPPTAQETLHHQHHTFTSSPSPSLPPFSASASGVPGGRDDDEFPRRDERCLQWSNQETRDFIKIRGQLEGQFTSTKRNKNLWEMVVSRMREKGYRRTPDQCKCKWKNLVNRYKGQETYVVGSSQQCPFFDELHAVLSASANDMHQTQFDYEVAMMRGKKRLKKVNRYQSAEEEDDESDADEVVKAPKRRVGTEKRQRAGASEKLSEKSSKNTNNTDSILSHLNEMLKSFFQQQQIIDMQWRESMEKRAQERDLFEQEWRQTMEKLERDRLTMEQAWREADEKRWTREESLAEKRDDLLKTLVNELVP
ncbi:trihelix transcription factor GT-3b-like [Olea europaea var. sylvestris]|uniref:trihelix transcription factor GT-3b-like n=1 Tax=Olea europaea var. sylvestris TaxID=158386 RepID=UPI000C1D3DC2|nr:trihelix transcription factor GT-3b-like [Olea europaea var. sylvestris]